MKETLALSNPWEAIDWDCLDRLRKGFLNADAGLDDYWRSTADLYAYDQTFAQRIGWKWDYVLNELQIRGWKPPEAEVFDWGCGSGIAHRCVFRAFPQTLAGGLALWDRSHLASNYASQTALKFFPDLKQRISQRSPGGLLLLSHVLTELTEAGLQELISIVREASAVIWVEPGTYDASRRLIAVREQLRAEAGIQVIAPCVHALRCGLLAEDNTSHWCHFFAAPPSAIFTDPDWMRFGHAAGIDLRSLPLSYLVLDRRPAAPLPAGAVRILGSPRVYKGYALATGCTAEGVGEKRISKRSLPEAYKACKKDTLESLEEWECTGHEVVRLKKWTAQPGGQES